MKRLLMGGLALAALTACTPAQVERAIADSEAKAGRGPAAEATLPPPLTVAPYMGPAELPDCEGAVVVVVSGENTTCDVNPPQRLDVRFPGSDGIEQEYFQQEADHMGGHLVWSTEYDPYGEFVAEGVDY